MLGSIKITKQTSTFIAASLTQQNSVANKKNHSNQAKNKKDAEVEGKSIKVSPFYIVNPFYLDELQREKDERAKRDQEIKQRMER